MLFTTLLWLLGMAGLAHWVGQTTVPVERAFRVTKVERENTKPTGDVIFWHLHGSGGVCSAAIASPLGQTLQAYEHYPQGRGVTVTFTLEPERELQKIAR